MYYVFKAKRWPEKEREKISELLTEKKCRFCYNLNKDVLHETEYYKITKAKFPYAPNHLLIIPNKHIPSLHFMNEDYFYDFINIIKRTKRLDINFMANYGFISGQTLSHLHIHLIGDLKRNPFKVEVNAPALFYDPLTLPIIYEAKLEKYLCENGLVFPFKKNFYRTLTSIFYELEEGLRRIAEGKNKYNRIEKYGFNKKLINGMSNIYECTIDEITNIDKIVEKRFGGFGINWHVNLTKEGEFIFNIIPRATTIKLDNPEHRFASLEMFYNAALTRGTFEEEEAESWKKIEEDFIKYVLKKI